MCTTTPAPRSGTAAPGLSALAGVDKLARSSTEATAVYRAIREKHPGAKWGFENNDRLNLVIEAAKANGGDITQASRDVLKNLPDAKVDAERVEVGRKAAREIKWDTEAKVLLGGWLSRNIDGAYDAARWGARTITWGQATDAVGLGSVVPAGKDTIEMPTNMLSELRVNFERHFRQSGHVESAKRAAVAQVQREWSVTSVAGDKSPYLMKHAPSTFLPPERSWMAGDLDKMMADATDKLLKSAGAAYVPEEKRNGRPAYILEADTRTHQEAAAKVPDRPTSFQIKILREDGLYHVAGRVAMPTEADIRTLPMYGDRMEKFDHRKSARDAADELERRNQAKNERRRAKQ